MGLALAAISRDESCSVGDSTMPFPRYSIRTLMIAVAIAAIAFWAVVSFPAVCYATALLGAFLVIPMIGASWGGYRSANRFDGSVVGGIVGAFIQSTALLAYYWGFALIAYCWCFDFSVSMHEWANIGATALLLLAGSVVLGSIAGLLVGIVLHRVWDR